MHVDHRGAAGAPAPAPAPALEARGLSVGYPGREAVLSGIDLVIPHGGITALIGANGSGKSTLLRTLAGAQAPSGGAVLLDGRPLAGRARGEVARALSFLAQQPAAPEGLTVRQLCDFGRDPHRGWLGRSSAADRRAVAVALEETSLTALAEERFDTLSGGQQQRAWLAMALAQDAPVMLLDEPTTYLDIAHQLEILELLRELNLRRGTTVVMVLHDLNQAAQYADRVIALARGRVRADGGPAQVFTEPTVAEVFGLASVVVPHPVLGTPLTLPLPAGQQNGS